MFLRVGVDPEVDERELVRADGAGSPRSSRARPRRRCRVEGRRGERTTPAGCARRTRRRRAVSRLGSRRRDARRGRPSGTRPSRARPRPRSGCCARAPAAALPTAGRTGPRRAVVQSARAVTGRRRGEHRSRRPRPSTRDAAARSSLRRRRDRGGRGRAADDAARPARRRARGARRPAPAASRPARSPATRGRRSSRADTRRSRAPGRRSAGRRCATESCPIFYQCWGGRRPRERLRARPGKLGLWRRLRFG